MTRKTLLLLGMLVIVAVPICLYAYCVTYLWVENAKPPLDGDASFMVASALFAAGQLPIAIYTKKALRFMAIACGLCGIVFGMLSSEGHGLGALIEMLLLTILPVLIVVEVILVIDVFVTDGVTERDPVRPGHCAGCDHDLTGNKSGIGPGCGEAVNAPMDTRK